VTNIRQITRRDKTTAQILQQYPVFIVTFREGTDLREVYKIKNLCHCIIHWEKYRAKRPIQQCFNCQKYGHSSAYCGLPAKCLKCKQAHQTQSCRKPPSEPPACVNCGGEHPANYTGCPVYKKVLESRTRKRLTPPNRTSQQSLSRTSFPSLGQPQRNNNTARTWAQVGAQNPDRQEETSLPSLLGALKSILSSLNLQTIGVALRTLATRLQDANNPLDQMMLILETIMTCYVPSP
jgi:hypothetical protein